MIQAKELSVGATAKEEGLLDKSRDVLIKAEELSQWIHNQFERSDSKAEQTPQPIMTKPLDELNINLNGISIELDSIRKIFNTEFVGRI